MNARLLACVAVLLLSGCGRTIRPAPSVLQRYNAVKGQLKAVTAMAGHLPHDIEILNVTLARGDPEGVQGEAVVLKRDAHRLQARSGRTAAAIRPLLVRRQNQQVRTYFALLTRGLSWLWWEGERLSLVSDEVWWDPLSTDRRDLSRLRQLDLDARWYAWRAVQTTVRAERWKRSHAHAFRYRVAASSSVSPSITDRTKG